MSASDGSLRLGWPALAGEVGIVVLLGCAIALGSQGHMLGPVALVVAFGVIVWRSLVTWHSMLAALVLVILFIPIRTYSLPGSLPIDLEPYRLIVALVAGAWLAASLYDRRVRLCRSGIIDAPLTAFLLVVVVSVVVNLGRIQAVGSDAIKAMLFFSTFILVVYLVASLVRTQESLDRLVKVLVNGGAVVALACLVERRTQYNVFNHLSQVIPILHQSYGPVLTPDARGARVLGSSQHPIAMGVALVMLVPLAVYRAFTTGGRLAWVAAAAMVMGAMGTISRTAIIALGAVAITMIVLKPRQMKRMWPAILPGLVVVHVAMPGTLGTIQSAFFPKSGLISQQTAAPVGSGRLATLGPALRKEFTPNPIVGEGFGTRVTTPDDAVPIPNAPILDDEWLGILLETGIAGALAFAWIFVRFVRRVGGAAKRDTTDRGWFLAAVTASVVGYAVSMFLYDALSFIQVSFLLFILLGLGSVGYRLSPRGAAPAGASPIRAGS